MAGARDGWYTDPTGRHLYRFWDGSEWTSQVSDGGASGMDPTELDPEMVATPPAPGSQAPGAPQATPTVQVSQGSSGFGIGALVGVLIALVAVVILVVVIVANVGDDAADSTTTTAAVTTTTASP